jgi:hypothetical protein
MTYPLHEEARVRVAAKSTTLFDYLDDPERLGSHMQKPSWQTGGMSMSYTFDANRGRAVGSEIRLSGQVAGIRLGLTEVVIERMRPLRKVWETVGTPHLLVVGPYRMGFDVAAADDCSDLCLFIDYAAGSMKPPSLGRRLARAYARWCVNRMAKDAEDHFKASEPLPPM